jgi:DNA-binding MarR family transcriptional regulator
MPKYDQLYRAKRPLLQMKILKSIALSGRLSQKKAIDEFQCKGSTISDAFKIMKDRNLIEITKHPDNLSELGEKLNREKFYRLSPQGLRRFIEENPSPADFWAAIIWHGTLNSTSHNRDEFNRHYDLFIERFIGDCPLRSCFFLGNLFENLFQRWQPKYNDLSDLTFPNMFSPSIDDSMKKMRREKTEKAYKVLKFLLLKRGITINKIIESIGLKEEEVREIIEEYSMAQTRYSEYIDDYGYVYQSSRSEDVTINFLEHILIVPLTTKEEKEKSNKRYELSLLGVLLVLATLSSEASKHRKDKEYFNYYDKAASNYREKLPLIFEKWKLLEKTLDDRLYRIFDYLLGDKAEILSLSLSLGGNKEIYDNIRTASMYAINCFSIVYDEWIHSIEAFPYLEDFRKTPYYRFIQEKINEMKISLNLTNLTSFGEYMKEKQKSTDTFEDDLHHMEHALADEFSCLFYVGLLRENNHVASDFPFTTAFTRPNPGFVYDKYFLDRIVSVDDQIRNRLRKWLKASKTYQDKASKKLEDIYQGLNNDSINNNN